MLTAAILCMLSMFICMYYTKQTLERGEMLVGTVFIAMFLVFGYLGAAFAALESAHP